MLPAAELTEERTVEFDNKLEPSRNQATICFVPVSRITPPTRSNFPLSNPCAILAGTLKVTSRFIGFSPDFNQVKLVKELKVIRQYSKTPCNINTNCEIWIVCSSVSWVPIDFLKETQNLVDSGFR
jgi:hypothetical protein